MAAAAAHRAALEASTAWGFFSGHLAQSWRSLADRVVSAPAEEAARLLQEAEVVAEEGRQMMPTAWKATYWVIGGELQRANAAGQRACQAIRAWALQAAKANEEAKEVARQNEAKVVSIIMPALKPLFDECTTAGWDVPEQVRRQAANWMIKEEVQDLKALLDYGTDDLANALHIKVFERHIIKKVLADMKKVPNVDGKYTEFDEIFDALTKGGTKLIKGSWFLANCDGFVRRQDLPPEAFWEVEDLRENIRRVEIVALSYCWLDKLHPDPRGEHLQTLKCIMKMRLDCEGQGRVTDVAMFLDFMSLPQRGLNGEARSDKEEELFKHGLQAVNVWYAHQHVAVWLQKWVSDDVAHGYDHRGWPVFENSLSQMITDGPKLVDISKLDDLHTGWLTASKRGRAGRKPPVLPEEFNRRLESLVFTNGADKEFVAKKYAKTFDEVIGYAKDLWFVDLDWGDEEAADMALVLPHCKHLHSLNLRGNCIGASGAEKLMVAAMEMPKLKNLDIQGNPIAEEDIGKLAAKWRARRKDPAVLQLPRSDQQASSAALSASSPAAAVAATAASSRPAAPPGGKDLAEGLKMPDAVLKQGWLKRRILDDHFERCFCVLHTETCHFFIDETCAKETYSVKMQGSTEVMEFEICADAAKYRRAMPHGFVLDVTPFGKDRRPIFLDPGTKEELILWAEAFQWSSQQLRERRGGVQKKGTGGSMAAQAMGASSSPGPEAAAAASGDPRVDARALPAQEGIQELRETVRLQQDSIMRLEESNRQLQETVHLVEETVHRVEESNRQLQETVRQLQDQQAAILSHLAAMTQLQGLARE